MISLMFFAIWLIIPREVYTVISMSPPIMMGSGNDAQAGGAIRPKDVWARALAYTSKIKMGAFL
jgi:hypothetical protein